MKPYGLVLYNKIKFGLKKIRTSEFQYNGIQMFSANLKLCLEKGSRVLFEDRIVSDGRTVIMVDDSAYLSIEKHVYFNEGLMISCKGRISIGAGCKFGPNVKIFDNNHRFNASEGVREGHSIGEITIGRNCWIGSNVVILKGADIEDNCVIGAGCVVSGYIPKASIATQGRELTIAPMRKG